MYLRKLSNLKAQRGPYKINNVVVDYINVRLGK